MKTKIKKNWQGREKSVEELHYDSKNWISEINFINDEIRFLNHLLSEKYIDCLDGGLFKKIKNLIIQISDEKKAGHALKEVINKHETILSDLIKNNSVESNKNYLLTHNKIEKEIYSFNNKYKNIKKDIFDIVENIMKQKEQKKLL